MRERVYNFIKKQLNEGRQAYIICPLVDPSDKIEAAAAVEFMGKLTENQLSGYRIGLLHGKIKDKDTIMNSFASGETQVLISTTVVEVGVNVPNATVMVVENAERFGLSQLHQLRGRIGRGQFKSTCVLVSGAQNEDSRKRLDVMCRTTDGFVIAEEDLKLRGAGEVLGTRQSGFMIFQMADLSEHSDLLWTATKDAKMILTVDCGLTSERGTALKTLLYLFRKDMEINTLKSG
jgi:ATP-dependent DNA helicase RecG